MRLTNLPDGMTNTKTRSMSQYIGRFAPSPTGELHFGSLIAAVGSYLQARSHKGQWLLRIEDIDPPREVKGATAAILRSLEAYGFEWDGPITYQSQREEHYLAALSQLEAKGLLYPCHCSRKEIAEQSSGTQIYPGTCRNIQHSTDSSHSIRIIGPDCMITYCDRIQGEIQHNLQQQTGDFILRRKDQLFAYQLAVSVDDIMQGVTEVVRGSDLMESTPQQIYLIEQLGGPHYKIPRYAHLPIAVNSSGDKLSKQTYAQPLPAKNPEILLCQALHFLGQNPPRELANLSVDEFWLWAIRNWKIESVPCTLKQRFA